VTSRPADPSHPAYARPQPRGAAARALGRDGWVQPLLTARVLGGRGTSRGALGDGRVVGAGADALPREPPAPLCLTAAGAEVVSLTSAGACLRAGETLQRRQLHGGVSSVVHPQ